MRVVSFLRVVTPSMVPPWGSRPPRRFWKSDPWYRTMLLNFVLRRHHFLVGSGGSKTTHRLVHQNGIGSFSLDERPSRRSSSAITHWSTVGPPNQAARKRQRPRRRRRKRRKRKSQSLSPGRRHFGPRIVEHESNERHRIEWPNK